METSRGRDAAATWIFRGTRLRFGYQIAFASAEDEELMDAMDDEEEAAEEPVAA